MPIRNQFERSVAALVAWASCPCENHLERHGQDAHATGSFSQGSDSAWPLTFEFNILRDH